MESEPAVITEQMSVAFVPNQCEHIRDNGFRCASPAMRGRDFCYYHTRAHLNIVPGDSRYEAPILDTDESIQLTVSHVIRGLLKGKIDRATAHTIFYGIQLVRSSIPRSHSDTPAQPTDPLDMAHELTPAMDRLITEQESDRVGADVLVCPVDNRVGADVLVCPSVRSTEPTTTSAADTFSDHNPGSPDVPIPRSPDAFASERSLKNDPDEPILRENRFTAGEIRDYWMQHAPGLRDLKRVNGEYAFPNPTWLPLQQDEIQYMEKRLPKPGIIATGLERRNFRRLEFHEDNAHFRPLTDKELPNYRRPKPTAYQFE